MRSALFLSGSLLLACHAYAQNTKEGYALLWSNSIAVVPDSLVNGKHKLPAFTITVFESDGNKALDLWRAEYKPMSQAISGSKPVIATGVVQPAIATTPLTILASSSSDKKLGIGRLTLAFGKNDSVPADEQQAAEKAMYDMAVKYNKAIVQEQITTKEKSLGKATSKEESAQASAAKLDKKSAKASNDLKKIKAKQGKIQANNAKMSGEIAGLEKKIQMTNDPKDLAKLAKMRRPCAPRPARRWRRNWNNSGVSSTTSAERGRSIAVEAGMPAFTRSHSMSNLKGRHTVHLFHHRGERKQAGRIHRTSTTCPCRCCSSP